MENFLAEGARYGLGKRDLVSNINWYMNVPVEADGTLGIVDGISAPGLSVALRAELDVLVLVSQLPADQQPVQRLRPDAGAHGRDARATDERRARPGRIAADPVAHMSFDTLLVANRGEIAVPDHPHRAGRSACARSPCSPTPTRRAARAGSPTRPSGSARRPRGRATCAAT